jgi:hypothetical protein
MKFAHTAVGTRPCFRCPAPRDKSRFWFPESPDGEEGDGDGY